MQCPDCLHLRHDGPCQKPSYEELIYERDEAEMVYMHLIKTAVPVRERSKEVQAEIDKALGTLQETRRKVWHYGII